LLGLSSLAGREKELRLRDEQEEKLRTAGHPDHAVSINQIRRVCETYRLKRCRQLEVHVQAGCNAQN